MRDKFQQNIAKLLEFDGAQQFKANDFRDLLKPGVYVCVKNGLATYVGMGKRMLARAASGNSQMKRRWSFEQCDTVLLYPCRSLEAAIQLEKLLIFYLKPDHNVFGKGRPPRDLSTVPVRLKHVLQAP